MFEEKTCLREVSVYGESVFKEKNCFRRMSVQRKHVFIEKVDKKEEYFRTEGA